jgi:hypothetical protein
MDNLQRAFVLPFVLILVVMLAIMAQITRLNPAGIGYGLTGIAHFALYGVVLAVIVGAIAWPIYLTAKNFRGRPGLPARRNPGAQAALPARDLTPTDSDRVRSLTFAQPLEAEQPIQPVGQKPFGPKSKTRKDIPFILPATPEVPQVTQQIIIQPAPPGIGEGTRGTPYGPALPPTPIRPSPINFQQMVRTVKPSRFFPSSKR